MEQEGHQISANLIRASDADFTPGRTDDLMVHEGKDQHTKIEQRALPPTQAKLGCVQKGGLKKGRWTRLSGRVGVDKLQSNNSTSSSIKHNFPGTFKAMVEDTETEKKFKLENEPNE